MRTLTCVLALACAVAAAAATAAPQNPDRSTRAVLARATAHLESYQRAFAFLVADEHYVQQVVADASGGQEGPPAPPRRRTMRGELFLTYLGADRRWIALHDIAEVDGAPVPGRANLRALLARSSVESVAGRLFRLNARFNIGSVTRTFNEPTLPLQVLDAAHRSRFTFRVAPEEGPDPPVLVTLAFRERERPTLVRSLDGGPVFSSGDLVIEAATGAIRRTRIAFRLESIDAELATTYAHEARLDLWVPTVFTERYTTGARDGRPPEIITAEARYENYRRFEGRGRVVPGPP